MKKYFFPILIFCLIIAACGKNDGKIKIPPPDTTKVKPDTSLNNTNTINGANFNSDSAYAYINKQMSFGPRVPNTKEHVACGDYLIAFLKKNSDNVIVQKAKVTSATLGQINIRNIIARFDEKNPNRIVLFAHWDTRYSADRNESTKNQKVPGADDGGSGVGILMEIARQLKTDKPKIGIDIILLDGEDQGNHDPNTPDTWCLGSQYWAKNNPIPGYAPKYGILLDMVGARSASFLKEGYSMQYASSIVEKVWNIAISSGYGGSFINMGTDPVTDDHYYINTLAKIPTIDIINCDRNRGAVAFGNHWHTPSDNMDIIDKSVLKAVGQTLMNVIYTEQ